MEEELSDCSSHWKGDVAAVLLTQFRIILKVNYYSLQLISKQGGPFEKKRTTADTQISKAGFTVKLLRKFVISQNM